MSNFDRSFQLETARSLSASHQYAAAVSVIVDLVQSAPGFADAWLFLAQLYLQLGDYESALAAASKAASLMPNHSQSIYTLGRVHKARGDLEAAEICYRRAIETDPHNVDVLTSCGIVARVQGKVVEAIELYRRALTINPDYLPAKINLDNALSLANRAKDGEAHSDSAPSALERELDRLRSLGNALAMQQKPHEAFAAFEEALRIAPGASDIWLKAGTMAQELGMPPARLLPFFEEAARLDSSCAVAIEMARQICFVGGIQDLTFHYWQLVSKTQLSGQDVFLQKLFVPAIQPSIESIYSVRRRFEQGLDEALAAKPELGSPRDDLMTGAFFLAYHGENNRMIQMKTAQVYLKLIPDLAMSAQHCRTPKRHAGRLRIGIISRNLAVHSIGNTTCGLVEHLSRDRFEVYVLRITPSVDDEMTRRICRSADHEVVLDKDFRRARDKIAALGLDVLFYQDIGFDPTAYLLAFARLAPVQCTSFGHPDTTGIPNIDYFISSDLYETAEAESHYSEQLFLLRDLPTLAYYYAPARAAERIDRKTLGLPTYATLYVCAQTLFKFHPNFDDILRGILTRDPLAHVILIRGNFEHWTHSLRERFALSMPEVAHRIIFLPTMSRSVFLELLAMAGVVLDTIHFNGMNSSLESFAVGTPVVTMPTQLQRGRHTQAMYRKMGILDCIAGTADEYVEIAVRLATDHDYARRMRDQILARSDILFEDPRVISEFERFFLEAMSARGEVRTA